MNQLNVMWSDVRIDFAIGDQMILKFEVNPRINQYSKHRNPRNTAVRLTTIPQFSPNYAPSKQMNWKEAIDVFRKYGATDDEISKFAHMGATQGWTDIEEIMLYNGQTRMF